MEYIGDDKYELKKKGDSLIHPIVAKSAIEAENQSHQIIKAVKEDAENKKLASKNPENQREITTERGESNNRTK